jgi:hypothetical protein
MNLMFAYNFVCFNNVAIILKRSKHVIYLILKDYKFELWRIVPISHSLCLEVRNVWEANSRSDRKHISTLLNNFTVQCKMPSREFTIRSDSLKRYPPINTIVIWVAFALQSFKLKCFMLFSSFPCVLCMKHFPKYLLHSAKRISERGRTWNIVGGDS